MKRAVAVVLGLGLALLGSTAVAAWLSSASGTALVAATDVAQAHRPTATHGAGSVTLSWTASTLGNGSSVGGYRVLRHAGSGDPVEVCRTTATTCTDSAPLATEVSYGVVATIGTSWTGPESPLTAFTYDDVAPTSTAAVTPTPNAAGWNKGPSSDDTVTLEAEDTGSDPSAGVDHLTYTVDGGAAVVVAATTVSFTVSGEGTHTVRHSAVDAAGNAEEPQELLVRIDPDAPVTTVVRDPAANAAGWNRSDVTLGFSAADADGSGVSSITVDGTATDGPTASTTLSAEGTHEVRYFATDVAGNEEGVNVAIVKIDKTAPTSSITSATPNTWTIAAVDPLPGSGVVSIEYWVDDGPHVSNAGGSAVVTVTGDGAHTIHWFAKDTAGNEQDQQHLDVSVAPVDTTAPTLSDPDPVDGFTAINNNTTSVNAWLKKACGTGKLCVTATDTGSGVDGTSATYSLQATSGANIGKCWNGSTFGTSTCAIGMSFDAATGRLASGNIPQSAMLDGDYSVTYTVRDRAGNVASLTTSMSIS